MAAAKKAETWEEIKSSITGLKSWATRTRSAAENLMKIIMTGNPTDNMVSKLEELQREYAERVDKILAEYVRAQRIAGMSEEGKANVDKKEQAFMNEANAFDADMCQVLATDQERRNRERKKRDDGRVGGGGGGGADRPKVSTVLQPDKLTRDFTPANMAEWSNKFTAFYNSSKLHLAEVEEQRAHLNICLDQDINNRLGAKVAKDTEVFGENGCMEVLDEMFRALYPLFTRRAQFFSMKQKPGQEIREFMIEVRKLADESDLEELTINDLIINKYISGFSDEKLTDKLMQLDDPSIKEVESAIEAYERASTGQSLMTGGKAYRVQGDSRGRGRGRGGRGGGRGGGNGQRSGPGDMTGRCNCCGSKSHAFKDCLKKDITCFECGKKGHFASVCMAKPEERAQHKKNATRAVKEGPQQQQQQQSLLLEEEDDYADPDGFIRVVRHKEVSRVNRVNKKTPLLPMKFFAGNGKAFEFNCCPDTGSCNTLIASNILKDQGIAYTRKKNDSLIAANAGPMRCPGYVRITMKTLNSGEKVTIDAVVCDDLHDEILVSWYHLQDLKVISASFPLPIRSITGNPEDEAASIKKRAEEEFPDVLKNTLNAEPMAGPPMKIHFREDIQIRPRCVYTARQIPLHQKEEADKVIQELLDKKVIVPVTEPTEWVSPGFFVPKSDGKVRLVTDFSYINQFISRPVHPFPSSKEILRSVLPESKVFAKLDAVNGYFQMALDEEDSFKTTFLLPSGRYRYLRGPMGLSPTSDSWCQRSDLAIEGLPYCKKIVDDILIEAPDYGILWERIRVLLNNCRERKMAISLKKFECGESITFAGHIVSKDGVKPAPEQTAAINEFPVPKDKSDSSHFWVWQTS